MRNTKQNVSKFSENPVARNPGTKNPTSSAQSVFLYTELTIETSAEVTDVRETWPVTVDASHILSPWSVVFVGSSVVSPIVVLMTLLTCWSFTASLHWYAACRALEDSHPWKSQSVFEDGQRNKTDLRGRPASTTFLNLQILTDVRKILVGIIPCS